MMKSLLEKNELLSAVNGFVIGDDKNHSECGFTSVQTDSRCVGKDALFVPLMGEFQNGHKFIPSAVEKGASVVFVNKDEFFAHQNDYLEMAAENHNVLFVCVKNTLTALQNAAEAYVGKFPDMIKVSITGSSGKTTTKEMTVSVIKQHFGEKNVAYTQGNFNSETGLPLSVFKINGNEKIGIFEMGMNRENEIGEISKVLKSKYGIITNIGTAHIGLLGSRQNIAREKRKSFDYIPVDGAAFVPENDDFADFCAENVKGKVVKYGKKSAEKYGVKFVSDNGLSGTVFYVDDVKIELPLSGEYNYQNALGVIALAKELGISAKEIKSGLENMSSMAGRMETKKIEAKNGKKIELIADCYNANPDSMGKVIDFCGSLSNCGKKIYVLGDMKELGVVAVEAHRKIGEKLVAVKADYVFLVGKDMESAKLYLCENGEKDFAYFADGTDENISKLSEALLSVIDDGDVVLLKGSHSMALERIIPLIEKKAEV